MGDNSSNSLPYGRMDNQCGYPLRLLLPDSHKLKPTRISDACESLTSLSKPLTIGEHPIIPSLVMPGQ
jgi:hypothetical protein